MEHLNLSSQDREKIISAVEECVYAIKEQINSVGRRLATKDILDEILLKGIVLAFLHGFAKYYSYKNGIRNEEHIWVVTEQSFSSAFGQKKGATMLETLLQIFKWQAVRDWVNRGEKAAQFSESKGLELLAGFIEGQAQLNSTNSHQSVLKVYGINRPNFR